MATPSLAMIPSAIADSKVYSVLPNNGDGDFTFNRDSSATRVGQNGLIQEVGYFGNDLVSNGDFSNGSTDWGLGSNWSVANGKASCDGSASNSMSQASTVGIASTTFKVSYDVLSISQGSIRITLGGVAGASVSQTGSYSDFITATSTDRFRIFADSSAIASIDNIIVQQVTGDRPRFNYEITNGLVGGCPSLLLEPASTNSLLFSEDYTNSVWTSLASGETIVSNSVISPDGTLNADTLEGNGSTTSVYVRQNITLNTSVDYTFSIFAKKGTNDFLAIAAEGFTGATNTLLIFDLNNSIVTNGTGSIENYGNGWLRCSFTISISTDGTGRFLIYPAYNGTTRGFPTASDSNGKNIFIWGAMVEQQSYPTSYIPTNGQSGGVTRTAETCFGAGTVSTFNSTEQVLYVEASTLLNGADVRITLSDGTITNRVSIEWDILSNTIKGFMSTNGNITTTLYNQTDTLKIALLSKPNNFKMFINGSLVGVDPTATGVTGLDRLEFSNYNSANIFYGKCKDLRVYNEALTDAQLQTLTTL